MPINSEIILFGIQAALKLDTQIRKAQVDKIKDNTLTLSTPKFTDKITIKSAIRYFRVDGKHLLKKEDPLQKIIDKVERSGDMNSITGDQKRLLLLEYVAQRNIDIDPKVVDGRLPKQHYLALMHIKQWEDGKFANPSPIQRIAGTLIDIGIDYFQSTPYLANAATPSAQMLKSFLDAIDEINFAECPLEDIASDLMVATFELLDEAANLISSDTIAKELLKTVTKGVVTDINTYIQNNQDDLDAQETARQWGKVVFKSLLNTTGSTVLANPSKFLNTGDTASSMISGVGNSMLDVLLNNVILSDTKVVDLKGVLGQEAINAITQSAVTVLADHPEWYDLDNEGLKNIITSLVGQLVSYSDKLGLDMLPDLVNMVLTTTSGNLNLIYQGDASKPANNLLLLATQSVLNALSGAVPTKDGQRWQPIFTKTQIVGLIDVVVQEVVVNPSWVLVKMNDKPALQDALAAVFKGLEGISVANLNNTARMSILQAGLSAVALRQEFLDKITVNNEQQQIISLAIRMTLDIAFGNKIDAKAKWALVSNNSIELLLNATLARIAQEGASESVINLTRQFIEGELLGMSNGQGFSLNNLITKLKSPDNLQTLLQNSLDTATRITAQIALDNPSILKIENEGIQSIITELAKQMTGFSGTLSTALLPDLAKFLLTETATNLDLIYKGDTSNPTSSFLLQTTQLVLGKLAEGVGTNTNFSKTQLLEFTNYVVQEVVQKPEWILSRFGVSNKPILDAAFTAAMSSLKGISVTEISNDTALHILKASMTAVSTQAVFLDKISVKGENQYLLSASINMVFDFAFGDIVKGQAKWAIISDGVIGQLVEAALMRIAQEGASENVIALTRQFIAGELFGADNGQTYSVSSLITKLKSPDSLQTLLQNSLDTATRITAQIALDNPSILKIENEGIQSIVTALANQMTGFSGTLSTALLPDLAKFLLTETATNLDLIYKGDTSNPTNSFLLQTTELVLGKLAEGVGRDTNFSKTQLLAFTNYVIQQVVLKPELILSNLKTDNKPVLDAAFTAALGALKGFDVTEISNDTALHILRASMLAVSAQQAFLDKISIKNENQYLLSLSLDMVFDFVCGNKENGQAKLVSVSNDVIGQLVEATLMRIAVEGASENILALTRQFIAGELFDADNGQTYSVSSLITKLKSPDSLQTLLQNSLDTATRITVQIALDNPSILKIENEGIRAIVDVIIKDLSTYPDTLKVSLLPDLGKLILKLTAENLDLIYKGDTSNPTNNLILTTAQTILETLSQPNTNTGDGSGLELPFTKDKALEMIDFGIQYVVKNPQWMLSLVNDEKPILKVAIEGGLAALEGTSLTSMTNETKLNVLKSAITAVGLHKSFLEEIPMDNGQKELLLTMALDMIFNVSNGESTTFPDLDTVAQERIKWILSDDDTVEMLAGAALERIAIEGASKEALNLTKQFIVSEVTKIAEGKPFSAAVLSDKLRSEETLMMLLGLVIDIEVV